MRDVLLVVAQTEHIATQWSKANVKAHARMPITCSIDRVHHYLHGLRDTVIVLVNCEFPIDEEYRLKHNTAIRVQS